MATTTSITTSYAGEKAAGFISASLLSAPTLDKGGITIKPNVKYKSVMQKLAVDDVVRDADCNFLPTSTVTLTERYLEPKEFQVNLELCKSDFHSDWLSVEQGFSMHDDMPKSFADYLLAHVAGKVAARMEQLIWTGADVANQFQGFLSRATADSDVIDVVTAETSITAANIIAELGKCVDQIPAEIYGNEGLHIYMSQADARSYIRAQAALGYKDLYHVGQTPMDFEGIKIFVANGLTTGKMVVAEKENLFFATSLVNDMNEVKLIDLADIDGSQNIRVVARFSANVNYAIGSEVVLYSI